MFDNREPRVGEEPVEVQTDGGVVSSHAMQLDIALLKIGEVGILGDPAMGGEVDIDNQQRSIRAYEGRGVVDDFLLVTTVVSQDVANDGHIHAGGVDTGGRGISLPDRDVLKVATR